MSRRISVAVLMIVALYVGATFLPRGAVWTAILLPGLLMMYGVASVLPTSIVDLSSKPYELLYIKLTFVCALLFWCGMMTGALAWRLNRQKR